MVSLGLVNAQSKSVSGKVVSAEDGEPILGATVMVKGTNTGTITDVNGAFTIAVPTNNDILVISFVGMKSTEVEAKKGMVVRLEVSSTELQEVVVSIAYGNAKKGTYTGSASVSNSVKTLKDVPVTSFESALQGSVSGVQVGVPNGQPGAQAQIRIRGVGSYNASNAPLYVIDGVPVNSGDYALVGYGGSMSIMSTLNPSDIEAVTVLKDAAATSMYGSRGANGVILVTTKKGKSGKLKVNLKGSYGINDFAVNNRPIVTGEQNRELVYEGAYNQAIYNGSTPADAEIYAAAKRDVTAPQQAVYSDWIGALTRNATNEKYELNISGGTDNTTFYASLGYSNNLGMYYDSWLDGYTGKFNLNHTSNNWTISLESSMASLQQGVTPGTSGGSVAYANPYYASRTYLSPNIPIYNADGSYYEGSLFSGNYYNLVADQKKNSSTNKINKSFNTISIGYEFTKGLKLKETLSYDFSDIMGISIYPSTSKDGEDYNGITTKYNYQAKTFYSSLLLTYDKSFKDHQINALVGWDVDRKSNEYVYASGKGFATPMLWELAAAAEPKEIDGNNTRETLLSYLGRLNYSYSDKYYASVTFRRDGSSRLGANTKWGSFWSVSASWRLKEEAFLKDLYWLDNLKVRSSYGTSGTLPSSLYSALATYGYSLSYNGSPASAPSRIENPDLSWEKNNVFDIGLEATLFNRLNVEIDYYNRQTNDMLLDVPLSRTTGFSTTLLNYGGMNNRGMELTLGYDIFKGDFKWNTSLNLTTNKNKVTKLYNGDSFVSGNFLIKEGISLYSYRAREWAGVDPGTGESMWYKYDLDDDGEVIKSSKTITKNPSDATRVVVGKADPDLVGGFRNTLSWKGFDLDLLFTFTLGGQSWDNGWTTAVDGLYTYPTAIAATQLDRWQKPGDVASFPRRMYGGGHGNYTSSRWMHSTDHLRLKSLTFGYTLPKKTLSKVRVDNARLFVAGTNLLTLAAYKDYDPETAISGEVGWAIPALKGITFGVEIGF